ncbi:GPI ethanolamine phosphate transferase 3 isoform X2 [Orussus abietinus]|nr:GPI ethanolamine phosphate transferase 3 isoform X2 [Orussus abietinus]
MSYLMIAGLLLFTNGFLLNRVSREERGKCTLCQELGNCKTEDVLKNIGSTLEICLEPRGRVVLLVIDALKYEFVEWHNDAASKESYYRNKLPVVHELLRDYPMQTRLYKLMADPPTTTWQRLKAITTGTLPTFADISSSFGTDVIAEDNFVDHNVKRGVVFMGDDTWVNFFPGKFLRQYPVPSFDVWDLDTVDRIVQNFIFDELKRKDWSLLVAHILGIDHCGHKHGPHHPEMTRKLNETNRFIKEIFKAIDDNTTLFIIGDHGMTSTGDHGGDSEEEVTSAMFVYSSTPLLETSLVGGTKTVNQIDLVPTLAAILGNPVPFSNIGTIILDAIPVSKKTNATMDHLGYALFSLWKNVAQTKKYMDVYSSDTFLFSNDKMNALQQTYEFLLDHVSLIDSPEKFKNFVNHAKIFLTQIYEMCAKVWIQFDSDLMSKGLVLMFCSLFFFYMIFNGIPGDRMATILESSLMRCLFLANSGAISIVLYLFWLGIAEFKNTALFATGVVSIVLLALLIVQNWGAIAANWYRNLKHQRSDYIVRAILLLSVSGLFSNSYIVGEDKTLSFLLITLIGFLLYKACQDDVQENLYRRPKVPSKPMERSSPKLILILLGSIACLCVRFSSYFWRCREEQRNRGCTTFVMGKTGSIVPNSLERALLTIAVLVLALYVTVIRIWLRRCGNLSGYAASVTVARYCPGIVVVCIGSYWVFQRLPKDVTVRSSLSWQMNALPGIAYSFICLAILILYYRPLTVYLLPKKKESMDIRYGENLVPRIFEHMKDLMCRKKAKTEDEDVPVVYGLGTVYSSAFVSLGVFLTLLHALLLGDVLAPSTVVMFITCASILGISAVERYQRATNVVELLDVPSSSLLCWFLIGEYFFYGTGHQPTFSTIHWDAAFIGTGGRYYGNLLPAILIGMNTFGSYVIVGCTLPLLVVAPFTMHMMFRDLVKFKFRSDFELKRGELLLFEKDANFHAAVFSAAGRYLLIHGIRTFCCMFAATIHCRHLMVWKIFAPKLIFEGIALIVTTCSILASFVLIIRIHLRVEKLITRVSKTCH